MSNAATTYPPPHNPSRLDPGEGYRILGLGEVLRPTDEYKSTIFSGWAPTRCAGSEVASSGPTNCSYRRRVEAAPTHPVPYNPSGAPSESGYRILGINEVICSRDEFWISVRGRWQLTSNPGERVGMGSTTGFTYRRRIEPQTATQTQSQMETASPTVAAIPFNPNNAPEEPGWRILSAGEAINPDTDRVYYEGNGGRWETCNEAWRGIMVGAPGYHTTAFRRPVEVTHDAAGAIALEQIITPATIELMKTAPALPATSAKILVETNQYPPPEVRASFETLSEWVLNNCKPIPKPTPPPTTVRVPRPPSSYVEFPRVTFTETNVRRRTETYRQDVSGSGFCMTEDEIADMVNDAMNDEHDLDGLAETVQGHIQDNGWDNAPDLDEAGDDYDQEAVDDEFVDSEDRTIDAPTCHLREVLENWLRANGTEEQKRHFGIE